MENTIEQEENTTTKEVDVRLVDTSSIETNQYNPNDMNTETFDTLVEHIKREGMQQPIMVRPKNGGGYIVVDGEHRFKAATQAGIEELVVVVVDYDDDDSKFKTIAMNEIRGNYIPLKMAKLLSDLADRYDEAHILRMTGLTGETHQSLIELLEVPDIDFDSNATITSMDVSRPISLNLMLMPDEHKSYTEAMIKAMTLAGPLVVPLVCEEVGHYDKAMTASFKLSGTKLRNVGLSTICKVFNALPEETQKKIINEVLEDAVVE